MLRVPQGSHLGSLLFSIKVNDISSCLKYSNYLLYADYLICSFCVILTKHLKKKKPQIVAFFFVQNDMIKIRSVFTIEIPYVDL